MSSTYQDFNRNLIAHLRAHRGVAPPGPFEGRDLVILTTRGAKTGTVHESPIVFSRDGDKYVVVASKGGAPTNPSWYHNLKAHPEVSVEIGGQKFKVRAQEAGLQRLPQEDHPPYPGHDPGASRLGLNA